MTLIDAVSDDVMSSYRVWATTPLTVEPRISVVIPAYNEAIRILPTIGAVAAQLCAMGDPWELVVSDDGSTDGTPELVRELGLANLRLLESPNTGKGGAVRRGMLAARGALVLFADADQSTPIEQLPTLIDAIDRGADLAVGSRAHSGATVANKSGLRRLLSWSLNMVVRRGFGVVISDTQCGFKLFTADAVTRLFPRQRIDGFSFDMELIYLAQRDGLVVAEVPVEWQDAPGSKVDPMKDSLKFLADLARIRWWSITGSYAAEPVRSEPEPAPDSNPTEVDQ